MPPIKKVDTLQPANGLKDSKNVWFTQIRSAVQEQIASTHTQVLNDVTKKKTSPICIKSEKKIFIRYLRKKISITMYSVL